MTRTWLYTMGTAAAAAAIVLAPASAMAQTAERSTPASVAGTWTLGLIGDHVIPTALVLEQKGADLSGMFIFMGKEFPVTGRFADGKITLTGQGPAFGVRSAHDAGVAAPAQGQQRAVIAAPSSSGGAPVLADMTISGTMNDEGGMTGTLATKMAQGTGMMKWSADRLKERPVPASQAMSTAAVNLTGDWTLSLPEAQQTLAVTFKHDGTKVTGTMKNDHLGTLAIDGTFASGTLSFVATGAVAGQDVKIEFSGTYAMGGTFAGDAKSQMGPLTWTAERVKK